MAKCIQFRNISRYHVLENRAPCQSDKVISPDPDAPELPPPLKPDSQDTGDTHPVYQDINELSCKSNEVVDGKATTSSTSVSVPPPAPLFQD